MAPTQHGPAAPLPDLIEESFDEAAFLWRHWERELTSLTRNLDEVWSWTEDRLHGALDGVRVAREGVIDLAVPAMQSDDMGRVSVSAALLGERIEQGATEALAAAIGAAECDRLTAIVRGLELLGSREGLRAAVSALARRGPTGAAAFCRLNAHRRETMGEEVKAAYASQMPDVQRDAIRAIRHSQPRQFDDLLTAALRSEAAQVKSAAVETAVAQGNLAGWETAKRVVRRLDENAAPYLKFLALFGTAADHEVVYAALRVPELQKNAMWALGHIGTPRAAEVCLAGMHRENLARAAGEAYCWITGADLVRDRLQRLEAAREVPAFDDDDLDANLVPSIDALWPLPDPDAAQKHWASRSSDFAPDMRHVHGCPVSRDLLVAMIESGPMLRRPDLVLELQARTRGRYDVETRAFAARQRQMMAAARATANGTGAPS